ncbi:RluA family pseudouridine synthase [Sporomusa acidovorans]|uniref:Pseudouridine synthase n=1 Tax=Sporomusa acidovorans (strain ATCC 49682 / DSM 3132 / Mol) TaxID=1123286 RepID=A0ABZ3J5N2_SPOA4|nr:RluA family pseudouridine synthase [Sporomusa acidovorans]OZC15586.1 ribosomal large subunit pseudouridine synthase D [Sporomusa acidovorans DSM 3132]SDE18944.1 23S rRNA pseudouridine1911/1915/1917 synthase [Sporomusa acidovorans]
MPDFKVPTLCPSLPVKDFLRRQAGLSLTRWRKIKNGGSLLINDRPAAANDLVYPGDIITATWPNHSLLPPEDLPLSILYEDEWLLAVDKPAGMLVHPATTQLTGTLGNAVMHYYHIQNNTYGFHPVNRLDRNTSGLVLIAKRPDIQHILNQNQQQISKQYLALTAKIPNPPQGIITAPIGRKPGSIIERAVCPDGQQAITRYNVLATFDSACLLKIMLETGRTHQIRVHLSYIGCPLLGDDLYGGPVNLIHRQALHAAKLSLLHPVTKQPFCIVSPLPADLTHLITQLGG